MKDKILQLRTEGMSYNEIVAILGCSKGTVAYHCGKDQKKLSAERRTRNRHAAHPYTRKVENFSKRRVVHCKIHAFTRDSDERQRFTVDDVLEKFGVNPTCALTGVPIDIYASDTYSFDHIIPKSRGGTSNIDNLQIVCREINQAKHSLTDTEFIELCRRVVTYADSGQRRT